MMLPHEDGFNWVQNSYIKSAYYRILDDFSVNANEICMDVDSDGSKVTKRSPTDKLTWWIISQCKGFCEARY